MGPLYDIAVIQHLKDLEDAEQRRLAPGVPLRLRQRVVLAGCALLALSLPLIGG